MQHSNWEGPMYWIRVKNRSTGKILYEYHSVFTDVDEAVEDIRLIIEEGRLIDVIDRKGEWIVDRPIGYIVELFDTHPDVPGSKLVGKRQMNG